MPELDPRWQAFWDVERWSLLWLEPPEHTRMRKLVAAAFTPRSVEALREPARELARTLLEPLTEAGEMELLYDFAQPYSISVICAMLGVPLDRHRDLLDWSHRIVKMYEFDVPDAVAAAANQAAADFRDVRPGADRASGARSRGDDMISRSRRGPRRRRAALRGRDRLDGDRAAQCGTRGDREHPRQRDARVRPPAGSMGASGHRARCLPPPRSRR